MTDSRPARRGWPLGFAHRGADVRRENTLAAFRAAYEAGFAYLELDVRTTADGELVVFHDDTLDRVSTGRGRLRDHTWERLADVTVGGEPLLRFTELLTALPEARLNVDLKDRASAPALARILAEHRAWDRVLVASFHDSRRRVLRTALAELGHLERAAGPARVATSGGAAAVAALVVLGPLGLTRAVRRLLDVDCVQVPLRQGPVPVVRPAFVRRAQAAGLAVHVWVVDDPGEMDRLLDMGVDGIMTDRADVLAEVYSRRGFWPQH
ncbi:glycerophosphodiester phosphodiesterase [Micrococcus luteus]